MNSLCTLYSSTRIEGRIQELIQEKFKKSSIHTSSTSNSQTFTFYKKNGLFKAKTHFQLATRYRDNIDLNEDTSELARNLLGIKGFVAQLPSAPPVGIEVMSKSIDSIVSETAVLCSENDSTELYHIVQTLAQEYDCIVFCQTSNSIGKGNYPHFLNKDFNVLLDVNGKSEVFPPTGPMVDLDDQEPVQVFPDQIERKKNNIAFLTGLGIPTIDHLPFVESEHEVTLRSSEEIAARLVVLAFTNLVAFSSMPAEEALKTLSQYGLEKYITPEELDFLNNPTEALKNRMSWRCEAIWLLCWALGIVDELGSAKELADLNQIDSEKYPISQGIDPNLFIQKKHSMRSKKEILDQNDLYYRMHWACVNERLKGNELTEVHPGVVYERQYALNWLVNYMNQDWDNVTCDT